MNLQLIGQALIAAGQVLVSGNASGTGAAMQQTQPPQPQPYSPPAGAGIGLPTGAAPQPVVEAAPVQVTDQMITDLITPHLGNETIKAALGAAMRANGVNNLPEMQPHQFATIYQAFKNVLAQHGVGGAAVSPPAPVASII